MHRLLVLRHGLPLRRRPAQREGEEGQQVRPLPRQGKPGLRRRLPEPGAGVQGGQVMNYVIIGNSVAAIGAVRGIRKVDAEGHITVLSRENHTAYGRPLISYLLGGMINEKRMPYLPNDFYEKNKV